MRIEARKFAFPWKLPHTDGGSYHSPHSFPQSAIRIPQSAFRDLLPVGAEARLLKALASKPGQTL
ncbi:MAG: hypothetical protein ACC628_15770, partial [Pirellulaceae bacterium]